jgi:hypothetical protein
MHGVDAVAHAQRLQQFAFVAGEVIRFEPAAVLLAVGDKPPREFALVEGVASACSDGFQDARCVRAAHALACARRAVLPQ